MKGEWMQMDGKEAQATASERQEELKDFNKLLSNLFQNAAHFSAPVI